MTINSQKLVAVTFTLGSTDYSCQVQSAVVTNSTPDGALQYTLCADGSGVFREVPDSLWAVDVTFFSDWTTTGINRYLAAHDGNTVVLAIDFAPGLGAGTYERTWTGNIVIKQPSDGGAARDTLMSKVTWNYIGVPVLTYPS